MTLSLASICACFDGKIPSVIATCAADGTPNVSYLSEVDYVDEQHVALSFQFFNKTRANVLAHPHATLQVWCPITAAPFCLRVEYLRTETAGPLFEAMKARLAGIAALSGMAGVFRLLGSDVYRVHSVERTPGRLRAAQLPARNPVIALGRIAERVGRATDLAQLSDATLEAMAELLGFEHAIILAADNKHQRLYTLGSRGYERSGIGSEVAFGAGVIGIAARERTPIRSAYATADYYYSRAVHEQTLAESGAGTPADDIPLPGLAEIRSQLAVPITLGDQLIGVIAVQSAADGRFTGDDQDALAAVALQFGLALRGLDSVAAEANDEPGPAPSRPPIAGAPIRVRHYAENDSVFLDDDYLIKGVAGAIFWKLVREHARTGRTEFSNRELRLSPDIRLPELSENLEARLVLLTRRLGERNDGVYIEKTGRGRFRLCVNRPLELLSG
jgi:adenylate cyclase